MQRALRYVKVIFFTVVLISCTKEDDIVSTSDGNAGIKELQVKFAVSDFKESTVTSQTEQEAAVKKLAVFLFNTDGEEVIQEDRYHTFANGKTTVTVPEGARDQDLRIYLLANTDIPGDAITEQELLHYKASVAPDTFLNKGFPMCTKGVTVTKETNGTVGPLSLQRVPSALYVQVMEKEGLENLYNNSYSIAVEGLQLSEGAFFEDIVATTAAQERTDYSSKLTAVNTPENVAYFYQSAEVTIHIIPKDSKLGKTKTITMDTTKTIGRNKKYLLKIVPVAPVADRVMDFAIQVVDWDTDMILVEVPVAASPIPEKRTLFAEGVDLKSGWYDLDKSWGRGGFSMDSNMCWAATSANMLQWWQDRYVAGGNTLPEGTPDGFTPGRENATYRQLAIFETLAAEYPNTTGNTFNGVTSHLMKFFPTIFPNAAPFLDDTYFSEKNPATIKEASDFIINSLRENGVLSVFTTPSPHVRTLWGCIYDTGTGIVESVYLTDSDDRRVVLWQEMPVKVSTDGKILIGTTELKNISALYAYPGRTKNPIL